MNTLYAWLEWLLVMVISMAMRMVGMSTNKLRLEDCSVKRLIKATKKCEQEIAHDLEATDFVGFFKCLEKPNIDKDFPEAVEQSAFYNGEDENEMGKHQMKYKECSETRDIKHFLTCFKELSAGARKCYTLYRSDETCNLSKFIQCNGFLGVSTHLLENTINVVTCKPDCETPLVREVPDFDCNGNVQPIWQIDSNTGEPLENHQFDSSAPVGPENFPFLPIPNPNKDNKLHPLCGIPILVKTTKIPAPLEVPTTNVTILGNVFGFSLPVGGALVEYKDTSIIDKKPVFAYYGLDSYSEFRKIYDGCYLLFVYNKPIKKLKCFSCDDIKSVCLLVDCPLKNDKQFCDEECPPEKSFCDVECKPNNHYLDDEKHDATKEKI